MDTVVSHLQNLQQLIAAVDTPHQRSAVGLEVILQLDSITGASLFAEICARPVRTKQAVDILVAEAMFYALICDLWPAEQLQHIREAAAALEEEITLIFLATPQKVSEKEGAFSLPRYTSDRVLTLGERKSLASRPSRRTIEKALMDPHPDVARKLLGNPTLTEADVVRIAAKSTMAPSVLCEIASHPRWRKQRTVQKALVNNRLLPADFALTLIPFLDRKSMAEVSCDGRLDESVQHAAAVLIQKS